MPNKPSKYGLKYFNIVDVATSYLYDTIPYVGKSSENESNSTECGKKMVESLARQFYGTNRIIGMDNYFTSIPLAKTLFDNKIGLIGTVRSNKNEVPEQFLAGKHNPIDSSLFAFDKSLTLTSYYPKVNKNKFFIKFLNFI
jgi:hypothetical protein